MNLTVNHIHRFIISLSVTLIATALPLRVSAFELDSYAASSALAEGRWVRVSVAETGMHLITTAELRSYGFTDPSKVRVYGYGGARLSDKLTRTNYTDDLPMLQTITTDRGIFFYAQGPETWTTYSNTSYSYHSLNPFSSVGYYFLSDREADTPTIASIGEGGARTEAATTFIDRIYHEKDIVSPGNTGHIMLGEDFRYQPSQTFTFELTDRAEPSVWMYCSFMANTKSAPAYLKFSANGEAIASASNDRISAVTSSNFYNSANITKKFDVSDDRLKLGITVSSSGSIVLSRLNFLDINYTRHIRLNSGKLLFNSSNASVKLDNASTSTHIWDVTDPLDISALNSAVDGTGVVWTTSKAGLRQYAAWDDNATLPSPKYVDEMPNQDLHAIVQADMVIVTLPDWQSQAERLAEFHRNSADSLTVTVVTQQQVFNEFSSGKPDVNAFRHFFKMLWDRGNASQRPLRFALLMGRGSYDNRAITSQVQAIGYPLMPIWQTDHGFDINSSYTSDDIMAFLEDNSGSSSGLGLEKYSIAVGRMPARSVSEAKTMVDKTINYANSSPRGEWKNQILLLADDMDQGVHMTQMETLYESMLATDNGASFCYNKVYLDAFALSSTGSGASYPDARKQFYRLLNEGTLWWNFIGHSNTSSMMGENILTASDIQNNLYYDCLPVYYGATCEILWWDADALSGAELMYQNANGGVIAACSATRPVYISENGKLTKAIAPFITQRDETGRFLPIGEIFRKGKGNIRDDKSGREPNNTNKLRYVFMGDPALRLATPANRVVMQSINGATLDPDEQVTIQARQEVTIKGIITDAWGEKLNDFNGTLLATLYDAEKSTTSNGHGGDDGLELTFEQQGDRLFTGRDSVVAGEFTLTFSMPSDIAGNFRPAAFNLYAYEEGKRDAIGVNRDFYVYGYDENAPLDDHAPSIDMMVLNHQSFRNGDNVNESPMLIVSVSDDKGINLSSAGVGRQMSFQLDGGEKTYTDLSNSYSPSLDNNAAGMVYYQLENLTEGNHTLRFRVWDTSGNMSEQTIEFFVVPGLSPIIFDVYSDVNPASVEANFYISHNRPDAFVNVTLTVYNLLGQPVWATEQSGRSDLFDSFPIHWDLTDNVGRRVPRGIYIYKAAISTDGEQYDTASKKIAVTAQ